MIFLLLLLSIHSTTNKSNNCAKYMSLFMKSLLTHDFDYRQDQFIRTQDNLTYQVNNTYICQEKEDTTRIIVDRPDETKPGRRIRIQHTFDNNKYEKDFTPTVFYYNESDIKPKKVEDCECCTSPK